MDGFFYRADRCDFDFEPCRNLTAELFEEAAADAVFAVHRRHRSDDLPISVKASGTEVLALGSGLEPGDRVDDARGLILCDAAERLRERDARRARWWREHAWSRPLLRRWHAAYAADAYQRGFFLHTNASGDFILAPRRAFDEVRGMCESTAFYMHLDAYAIVQLFAAGYRQAVFAQPHRVYHADHDRSARADFKEGITWVQHEAALSAILRREQSYRMNGEGWGLGADTRPEWRLGA